MALPLDRQLVLLLDLRVTPLLGHLLVHLLDCPLVPPLDRLLVHLLDHLLVYLLDRPQESHFDPQPGSQLERQMQHYQPLVARPGYHQKPRLERQSQHHHPGHPLIGHLHPQQVLHLVHLRESHLDFQLMLHLDHQATIQADFRLVILPGPQLAVHFGFRMVDLPDLHQTSLLGLHQLHHLGSQPEYLPRFDSHLVSPRLVGFREMHQSLLEHLLTRLLALQVRTQVGCHLLAHFLPVVLPDYQQMSPGHCHQTVGYQLALGLHYFPLFEHFPTIRDRWMIVLRPLTHWNLVRHHQLADYHRTGQRVVHYHHLPAHHLFVQSSFPTGVHYLAEHQ